MRQVRNAKLVLGLVTVTVAAILGGFLLGRLFPCGLTKCATVSGSSTINGHLPDQGGVVPVLIGGRTTSPISPGDSVPLNLTLRNHNDFAVTTNDLAVTVKDVNAPMSTTKRVCTSRDFRVEQASSLVEITLAPHQSTTLEAQNVASASWPQVAMRNTSSNQDGCKGATLTLHYAVSGQQVTG